MWDEYFLDNLQIIIVLVCDFSVFFLHMLRYLVFSNSFMIRLWTIALLNYEPYARIRSLKQPVYTHQWWGWEMFLLN